MERIAKTWPVSLLLVSFGCGGLIVIEEPHGDVPCETWQDCPVNTVCEEHVCVEADPCSPANPNAPYCPDGRTCVDGVCTTGGGVTEWCEACPVGQGCLNGECVVITVDNACSATNTDGVCPIDEVCVAGFCVPIYRGCDCEDPALACEGEQCIEIPPDRACSPTRLDGLCPDGQVCVAGSCVPMENGCSAERPWGLCPSGSVCSNGFCIPITDRPCGPAELDGLCPPGQVCQAPGQCVTVPCSDVNKSGTCAVDQVCVDGVCRPLPCSPLHHTAGACPSDLSCLTCGECLPEGSCCDPADCQAGTQICSCERVCINSDTCLGDCDCPQFFVCDVGGSYACVRDTSCLDDSGCFTEEFCATSLTCLPDGSCEVDGDCRNLATRYCSAVGDCSTLSSNPSVCLCLDIGQCRTDADCVRVDPTYSCSSLGNCVAPGTCQADLDCPPGHLCDTVTTHSCVKGPDLCTSNDFTDESCTGTDLVCCNSGTCCSAEGDLCSDQNTCIDVGQCLTVEDCLGGSAAGIFDCSADYQCVPVAECPLLGCGVDQKCSVAEDTCIPDDRCAGDADCAVGEYCHATFTCVPAFNCGEAPTEVATLLKANVMLLVDRSSSMQKCDASIDAAGCCGSLGCTGSCTTTATCVGSSGLTTRWGHAVDAIDTITSTYEAALRFGLATYPEQPCGHPACGVDCNSCSCETRACSIPDVCTPDCVTSGGTLIQNTRPGTVDVPIQEFAYDTIHADMQVTYPGGATPTGPTLRGIRDNPYGAGGAGFTQDGRQNVLILITDGEANGDPNSVSGTIPGCADTDYACKVNAALDDLRALASPIFTYVVGFAFTGVNSKLNCHAVHGGRSLCPADSAYCTLFDTGGETACETVHCAWDGTACLGDATYCARFTDDGETACNAQEVCAWSSATSVCGGNDIGCGTFTTGGQSACVAGDCYWDGTNCRDVCWTFEAGGQPGCEAVSCLWSGGVCSGNDAACATLSSAGAVTCNAETGCTWDGVGGACVGDDTFCALVAAGGQTACEAGMCFWESGSSDCVEIDATNCATAAPACYYDATDAAALGVALDDIVSEVASCVFRLGSLPPDPDAMYVYLDFADSVATPDDCSNDLFDLCRLPRDRLRLDDWDFDPANVQVEFYGDACDHILNGRAVPLILFGCSGPGG
jgi:hypothetical protein